MTDGTKGHLEKRREPRRDLNWDAAIIDSSGESVSLCRVVNISITGAQLLLPAVTELPDSFTLLLSHKGEVKRQCRVAWHDGLSVGVSFVQPSSAGRGSHGR